VWRNFALGEFPHTPSKLLLFLGKTEFHGVLGSLWGLGYTQPKFAL
jgi:hypothetical protein